MKRPSRWAVRMGQSKAGIRSIGTAIVGVVVLASIFSPVSVWKLPFLAIDFLVPPTEANQRIKRAADGYAISFPPDWEYADAAEADPRDWYAPEQLGNVDEFLEKRVAEGLLQLARTPGPRPGSFEVCNLQDWTGYAAAADRTWTALEDAEADFISRRGIDLGPIETVEAYYLELPAGNTLTVETRLPNGVLERGYIFFDGKTWFALECGTFYAPPKDRWLSITESFEFLPAS